MKSKTTNVMILSLLSILSVNVTAEEKEKEKEIQDMSDPLAIYTQAGVGVTDKGLNVKIGQTYDSGKENVMATNIIEIKGFGGELTGWSGNSKRDNSIDSFRFRNFQVNTENGRGTQLDINYNVESETIDTSYSFIQSLPKFGKIQFFPLAGVGVRAMNGEMTHDGSIDKENKGYTVPGTFAVVGTYTKIEITDKIWLNYNPMWMTTISGAESFKNHAFYNDDSIIAHEFALSYQITPVFNVRYFANWNEHIDFKDGDQRVELNYQF